VVALVAVSFVGNAFFALMNWLAHSDRIPREPGPAPRLALRAGGTAIAGQP